MNTNKKVKEIVYAFLTFFVMYGSLLTAYLLIEDKENIKLIRDPLIISVVTILVSTATSYFWPSVKKSKQN